MAKGDGVVGQKIAAVRNMTAQEAESEGWDPRQLPVVIQLANGTLLYPSRDEEGNGPGVVFGREANGSTFWLSGA